MTGKNPLLATVRLFPLLAGLAFALEGCRTLNLAGDWALAPVAADGETTEWTVTSGGYYQDDDVQVRVSNDSNELNLAVRFRAGNEKWARPCAMTGLSVWLCPNGKKSRDTGLRFNAGPAPTGQDESAGPAPFHGQPGRPALDGRMVFVDRPADTTATLPPDGTRGPRAGFTSESGTCTYELSIPLLARDSGSFGLGSGPGSTVMLGLSAGPGKEEREAMAGQKPEMPEGGSGGRPGGMGGGPPGGRGGPPGGGRGPAETKNPELWFKVKLAQAGSPGAQEEK